MNPWEEGIWCVTIAVTAAVLVKLWLSGLLRLYKLLFCYLAFDFLSNVAAQLIPYRTTVYGYYYLGAQAIHIVIAAFMVMEICGLSLERTPALAQFGRNTVGYILALAALAPVAGIFLDRSPSKHPYLRTFLLFEQTMDATMAIFLVLISIFMAWFPVRLRRNVIVYISGFIVWSLSRSLAVHMSNQWAGNKRINLIINIALMCIEMGCLFYWLVGLRREGESRTAVVGHLWNRAEADRLTEQLDAINDSIARMRERDRR